MNDVDMNHPVEGEVVLHCGHLVRGMHWLFCNPAVEFRRPDGTGGRSSWIAACGDCYNPGMKAEDVNILGDGIWKGTMKAVKKSGGT